ncbi:MAG: hypothetical protein K6G10_06960 [Butyrivibrio sp.]|nr:hypothetical protein [Butyrivibrio sp.]
MFTENDFLQIDKSFEVITKTSSHIILKSQCGHIWDIYCRDMERGTSLVLYHKHKEGYPFHEQPFIHPRTVQKAMEYIRNHDKHVKT